MFNKKLWTLHLVFCASTFIFRSSHRFSPHYIYSVLVVGKHSKQHNLNLHTSWARRGLWLWIKMYLTSSDIGLGATITFCILKMIVYEVYIIKKRAQTQLSGTFPPFIIVNWKFISTSVRKSSLAVVWCFKRCSSLLRNDVSEVSGIISWWWMLVVNRGYWGIRSGSCSSSIVSILPRVLMLEGL